jgi:flavin reductase (DIM6/NTAB) family NADH-FMN oxidoreductase RutF
MEISAVNLDPAAAYKLLIGIVVPRPIAWVTTLSPEGHVNAAPFSAFTFLSSKPPMIAIGIGRRAGSGALKDTARNIETNREFVVNIADDSRIDLIHSTAAEYPSDVSEVEALGLEVVASRDIAAPRLAIAPIALECILHRTIELGDDRDQLIIGEVRRFHVREDLYENGKIDSAKLRPVARLGGPNYAKLGQFVTVQPHRPVQRP